MLTARGIGTLSDNMLGSTGLDDPRSLGVAWESYGFTPGDTGRVSIRVGKVVEIGRLRRVGMRLGVANDPRTSVTVSWSEPDPARGGTLVSSGTVPIVLRYIGIDVSRLDAGDYELVIEMERRGCHSASTFREFTIWR
jgi:hypothetical protein